MPLSTLVIVLLAAFFSLWGAWCPAKQLQHNLIKATVRKHLIGLVQDLVPLERAAQTSCIFETCVCWSWPSVLL